MSEVALLPRLRGRRPACFPLLRDTDAQRRPFRLAVLSPVAEHAGWRHPVAVPGALARTPSVGASYRVLSNRRGAKGRRLPAVLPCIAGYCHAPDIEQPKAVLLAFEAVGEPLLDGQALPTGTLVGTFLRSPELCSPWPAEDYGASVEECQYLLAKTRLHAESNIRDPKGSLSAGSCGLVSAGVRRSKNPGRLRGHSTRSRPEAGWWGSQALGRWLHLRQNQFSDYPVLADMRTQHHGATRTTRTGRRPAAASRALARGRPRTVGPSCRMHLDQGLGPTTPRSSTRATARRQADGRDLSRRRRPVACRGKWRSVRSSMLWLRLRLFEVD